MKVIEEERHPQKTVSFTPAFGMYAAPEATQIEVERLIKGKTALGDKFPLLEPITSLLASQDPAVLLEKALRNHDYDRVKALIAYEPTLVNTGLKYKYEWMSAGLGWFYYSMQPLHIACWEKDKAMVKLLLQLGANPNQKSYWSYSTRRTCDIYKRSVIKEKNAVYLSVVQEMRIMPKLKFA